MTTNPSAQRRRTRLFSSITDQLPHLGLAGSRSALLHQDSPGTSAHLPPFTPVQLMRLRVAVFSGTLGSLLIMVGGMGAGAFPVVDNPLWDFPGVSLLARMLHTTSVAVFVGIGFLVCGWLLLMRLCAPASPATHRILPERSLWRIFVLWVTPFLFTPPLFTQDIYSYLAQGAIAARGWNPYSAGPVDLLGIDDPLARSVPLMWAHSPAPYGPVALGYGQIISIVTNNSIGWGVFAHRVMAIIGLALVGWALVRLSRRCGVPATSALWLGVLNPLAILHLVGGIHNEAIMLGLLLAGMELVLRGVDQINRPAASRWFLVIAGMVVITGAGLVKVTAFMGLGFAGVAVARWLGGSLWDLCKAAVLAASIAAVTSGALSLATGVGLGWVSSQGGAADIISWMSIATLSGLASSTLGMMLGLGDHQPTTLMVFQALGLLVGLFWVVRMLWAAFRGRIHPVGALGVAMLMLVIFFPVVHPWYLLWAILPMAAWANRRGFHVAAVVYSVLFSFFILPRGLALPPTTVLYIYFMAAVLFAAVMVGVWQYARRHPLFAEAIRSETLRRTKVGIRD